MGGAKTLARPHLSIASIVSWDLRESFPSTGKSTLHLVHLSTQCSLDTSSPSLCPKTLAQVWEKGTPPSSILWNSHHCETMVETIASWYLRWGIDSSVGFLNGGARSGFRNHPQFHFPGAKDVQTPSDRLQGAAGVACASQVPGLIPQQLLTEIRISTRIRHKPPLNGAHFEGRQPYLGGEICGPLRKVNTFRWFHTENPLGWQKVA